MTNPATALERSADEAAYLSENPAEVGGGVGEHSVGGQVPRERVGEEVTVAGQSGPWLDAGGDASLYPVRLRQVASRDPEPLHGQTDQDLSVPRRLVARQDLTELFEGSDESVEHLVGSHSPRASAAPGTSSVMTWT